MADDKSKTGGLYRTRIKVQVDYELRDRSEKFGVTPDRLKDAVAVLGTLATDVESYHTGVRPS